MSKYLQNVRTFIGPYDYRPGFIYWTILIFNLANLRTYTFDYAYGMDRINFFFIGLFTYAFLGLPLYFTLKLSRFIWRSKEKKFGPYLLELMLGSLITLLAQIAGQKFLIPVLNTVDFLEGGVFIGEVVTRFFFAFVFVAITHSRLKILGLELDKASSLNDELNDRYAKLVETDEEIRSHASQLLHDRIQSKLMLAGAKLTRLSEVFTDEGKLGVQPVIKELERIRSIDIREVSQLLSPNLASEGLMGSCENLLKEFEGSVEFEIKIDGAIENLCQVLTLGIYRIIEQGVANAINHGPAKKVSIEASLFLENEVKVEIRDNGPGASSEKSGTGSVIIDAWVSILDGRKEIESVAGKGYTLRVFLSTLEKK
jgi:signal transduction histidine kinase